MALFNQKKNTKAKPASASALSAPRAFSASSGKHAEAVLICPRITEKGTMLAEHGAYVFNVGTRSNKREIAAAVASVFKVTPVKVRVVAVRSKAVRNRSTGIAGRTSSGKKAYVYLKKGETIEIA